jgi:hypothetical protein
MTLLPMVLAFVIPTLQASDLRDGTWFKWKPKPDANRYEVRLATGAEITRWPIGELVLARSGVVERVVPFSNREPFLADAFVGDPQSPPFMVEGRAMR